ncbi:SCO1860 family LAETG-anchored protein [Streptomyces megasporus]|uniref:SCO1860 family LAETG-anchored protein n=1 Tax=Streptomyces megasporus TaxID=44060 RepID=UPI000569EE9B|nr:SCO1860 family LAETG-anchored protein [Streptomyces megasporus]
MKKSVYSLFAAAALVGVAAVPAHATGNGGKGTANAAVFRAKLGVSLLDETAVVPLNAELNAVQAPESAAKTALTVRLDGAHNGKPIRMLHADVATAKATADEGRSEGYSNLTNAKVYVPGLLRPLLKADLVTSRAVCEAGAEPTAESEIPGTVTVLGRKVAVKAEGTTSVEVDGVGTVELRLAETTTTSHTAAATALALDVAVDPADLGVAKVEGRVTLVEAACQTPGGDNGGGDNGGTTGGGDDGGTTGGGDDGGTGGTGGTGGDGGTTGETTGGGDGNEPRPQTGPDRAGEEPNLAETGGDSSTPYIAGGALAFLAVGGALVFLRRRRAS